MKYVEPKTFLVGVTGITSGLEDYLNYSGNQEFLEVLEQAKSEGLSEGEILCSFYAKLCYKSLTLGKNANVTKIRDIESNLMGCFDSGHGSVFEHCLLNFITTDCSRVFTHELVRHRVGTAFSQTSGRYVAIDSIDFIVDPLLVADPECDKAIQEHIVATENLAKLLRGKLIKDGDPFDKKKKVTSAIRRIAPNGQSNEIGFSMNIRTLRQTLCLRTSPHAEWEIRLIFNQISDIVYSKWPLMFYGLNKVDTKDGLFSWENV
jgi:thymidylate synthase (FAD)